MARKLGSTTHLGGRDEAILETPRPGHHPRVATAAPATHCHPLDRPRRSCLTAMTLTLPRSWWLMLKEPRKTYATKEDAGNLTCRVAHAKTVHFTCDGEKMDSNTERDGVAICGKPRARSILASWSRWRRA